MHLRSLLESVRDRAETDCRHPALVSGAETWTYADLWMAATAAAGTLRAAGVVPGRPVAARAGKTPATVALLVGAGLAGAPVVLAPADLGEAAWRRLLVETGSSHVVSVSGAGDRASLGVSAQPTGLLQLDVVRRTQLARSPLVLTTSGSTGTPKLVPLSGAGVERFLRWACATFGITAGTRVLSYAPLTFDLALLDVWAPLAAGGTTVLVREDEATDPERLRGLLAAEPVHVVQGVPLLFRLLGGTTDVPVSRDVRHVILTGDVTPPQVLSRLPALFPAARVHNVYGCTETNDSFIHEVDPGRDGLGPLPIGRPIEGVSTVVAGDEAGQDVGELLVATPFQAEGYLDPALTAERFVERDGRTYFRTGDRVRRDGDGLHHLVGREDFQVKVRGVRTNVQEVEHVLEQHPGVVEAAVVALTDPVAGHRLHAAVRIRDERGPNGLQLRSHCSAHLPRTAIPSSFDIRTAALHRTSTGKVDRRLILSQQTGATS